MLITRSRMVKDLSDKTEFYEKNIKDLLYAMDDLIKDYCAEVTEDEELIIQLTEGIKIICTIQPERQRKNPQTGEQITCAATVKPRAVFSKNFKDSVQERYEAKKAE